MPRGKKGGKTNSRSVSVGSNGAVVIRSAKPKNGRKKGKARGLSFGADLNSKVWSGGFKWTKDEYNVGGLGGVMDTPQKNSAEKTPPFILAQKEQLFDVVGSNDFDARSYALQPGDPNSLPWASSIATKYERYVIDEIEFEYVPVAGIYSDAGAKGTVVLSFDYDASEPPRSASVRRWTLTPM